MNIHKPVLSIRAVEVRRLFGHLDYCLKFDSDASSLNRLVIMYGDNGCGKTTILRLLFHLLSPVDNKGHKSAVTRVRFERLKVTLSDGTVVAANRKPGEISGNLMLSITRGSKTLSSVTLVPKEDGVVRMVNDKGVKSFLAALSNLELEIFFMRDNRRFTSSIDDSSAEGEEGDVSDDLFADPRLMRRLMQQQAHGRDVALLDAIEKVNRHFSQLALAASQRGAVDTNRVYDDIIKYLLKPRNSSASISKTTFASHITRLQGLREVNNPFVTVGLTTSLIPDDTISQLQRAPQSVQTALLNVVKPYIDGVAARLEALGPINTAIWRFQNTLNSFLTGGKAVSFTLKEGLKITGFGGSVITPGMLSSGEKQLLLMLCSITVAGSRSSIFIIDEPEISLNIKWQRRLVGSLLEITSDSPMQFIMASHSMELIAKHRSHVVALRPCGQTS